MTTTTSVHLDVTSDVLAVGEVQAFLRSAAVLGAQPADPVERVRDTMNTEESVIGLRVQGDALAGTTPAKVAIDRRSLLELHDALCEVIDSGGDARSALADLTRHRDDLQDALMGR